MFVSLEELPALELDGVVIANELLDNLPFGIVEYDGATWQEVRVALRGDDFCEVMVPAPAGDAAALHEITRDVPVEPGARLPIPRGIDAWFAAIGRVLRRGVIVTVDYVDDASALVGRARQHGCAPTGRTSGAARRSPRRASRISPPTWCASSSRAPRRAAGFAVVSDESQAEWLRGLDVDGLVAEGRRVWEERAHIGDLEALAGRSRVTEAAALVDPAGLGAHRVVTLAREPARDAAEPGRDGAWVACAHSQERGAEHDRSARSALAGGANLSAARIVSQDRARHRRHDLRRRRARLAGLLGHAGARARLVARVAHDPRVGSRRSPSGSSAASSTSSYNCLDRHVEAGHGDQVAFHWEGEPGDSREHHLRDLLEESSRVANALRSFGVAKGDRVAIYMGMVPEAVVAMLACARIGAPHSVVFGGFSARVARGPDQRRAGEGRSSPPTARGAAARVVPLKHIADEAVAAARRRSSTCSSCGAPAGRRR